MNDTDATKAALRKAATIIQRLERQVEELSRVRNEPIAVIGAGCRLPGGVSDLSALHALLMQRAETVTPLRLDRFPRLGGLAPNVDPTGGVQGASFIDGIEDFDADFWGISAREAAIIDPQHRLLLECAWEAIEHARVPVRELRGRRVGVYVGPGSNDYAERVQLDRDHPEDTFKARLGTSFSVGRISFLLGLQGPAVAVEAACASSLVAVHLACQALRAGECELALAGGVQALLSAGPFLILAKGGALSSDGRCRSFSAQADGYGRGEGCGLVLLKPLSAAVAAGDRILGVIRGTAVNHDGPRSALTTPNGTAQRALLRQALLDARLEPTEVDYVEAHAIGTSLGDVIEVEAIADVYGAGRSSLLRIGSSKANFGHLEPASGVVALLKVLALLQHEQLTPNLFTEQLNPHLDWAHLPVRVVQQAEAWPRSDRPRRAGVSAFGLSGTNAHAVLEEAPALAPSQAGPSRSAELVLLSARSPGALTANAARLSAYLTLHPDLLLGDLAYSLACTRTLLPLRAALAVATPSELTVALQALVRGETPAGASRGDATRPLEKCVWLLGNGADAQLRTAPGLHKDWPVFSAAFEAALRAFDAHSRRPLQVPDDGAPPLSSAPSFSAAAQSFAWQYAACKLWRSFGVQPNALIGQDLGQIGAACVAGVFSLTDAAKLIVALANGSSGEGQDAVRLSQVAASIDYHAPQTEIFGANGERLGPELANAEHWARLRWGTASSLRLPPSPGITGYLVFGSVTLAADAARPSMLLIRAVQEGASASQCLLAALGRWVVSGGSLDWREVSSGGRAVDLPSYAWQRQRYWTEASR